MKLNPHQKEAVKTVNGRVLVLAGAGSGKTRVIIQRICYLIQNGIPADSILGLTFTNKAAKEMKERLKALLKSKAKEVTLSTFHSFCMRILRAEIEKLGYTSNFSLYDERDKERTFKQIARDILKSTDIPSLQPTMDAISAAKSQGLTVDEMESHTWHDDFTKTIYKRLEAAMKAYNAVDFDSLISLTIELFEKFPKVLEKYQDQFRYIMIDEYQDTNPAQFKLAELLTSKYNNLMVVGDDDQSIYGFRGSEVKNILNFNADKKIKLEQNYRSTPVILKAANAVITHNSSRYDKKLWCEKEDTTLIEVFTAPTETDEASAIVDRILNYKQTRGYDFKDMAILYRSNALSRNIELALMGASYMKDGSWIRGIPYQVTGGLEFAMRAEIKDLSCYLRAVCNPNDQEAIVRIINVPRRGVSDVALDKLTTYSRKNKIPLMKLLRQGGIDELSTRAKAGIRSFLEILDEAHTRFERDSLSDSMRWLLQRTEFQRSIAEDVKSEKMRAFKWENVSEFVNSVKEYEDAEENPSLQEFISHSSLIRQKPNFGKNKTENKIQLMTFHSSKGLEFKACFLIGLEDHILPHEKSMQEGNLEEERRLFYVGITRAQEALTLSMAKQRKKMGKTMKTNPSRFLFEIPKNFLDVRSWNTFR